MIYCFVESKAKNVDIYSTSSSASRPNGAEVKNIGIDIDDILGSEISVNIDIGKRDIDPALVLVYTVEPT